MRPMLRSCFVVVFLCLLVAAAPGANLIKNGSFENPVVPDGGFQSFATGQAFPKWTVVGATGNVAIVSGDFAQSGFTFPAKKGKQWLDLTGTTQTATGVAQTVATSPGAAYTLTFFVGNIDNPNGIFGISSTVNVFVDGIQVYSATNKKGQGQTAQVWQKFITTITATGSKTAIAFVNGDPSNDTTNGLDGISLLPQADDEPDR